MFAEEGFIATTQATGVNATTQIGGWTEIYNSGNFAPATGVYTAPASGRYMISATISYQTTAAIQAQLGAGVNPAFVIRKIAPGPQEDLISGLFPILDVNILLLITLRVILGSGTVTIVGDVQLDAGDEVALFYVANGLTIGLNLGGGTAPPIHWSIHRIE
ncbi:hypothetical protein NST62_11480 [Ureibacillus sp. FSL K6-8385]|uniref:hypothetical protein n=1 Tax=Ureibacillus TaxID=160795 RepID=UPI002E1AF915|nr:hypothetical protein [Ureibacillus terrenus]